MYPNPVRPEPVTSSMENSTHELILPALPTESSIQDLRIERLLTNALSIQSIVALAGELFPIYIAGFMHQNNHDSVSQISFYEDLLIHLGSTERIVVTRNTQGLALGFICGSILKTEPGILYHLEGIILDPRVQGRGLGFAMLKTELEQTGAEALAFHTQSKHMLRLGERLALISAESTALFSRFVPHHHLVNSVDRARYGDQAAYGDLDRFREIAINELKVEQGDALFAAGYVRKEAA